jgi:hypothetical protein
MFELEKGRHVGVDTESTLDVTILQGGKPHRMLGSEHSLWERKKIVFYNRPEGLKIGNPC